MPFTEDQLLPISALQHLLFCERQCALIHLEQVWAENQFTRRGPGDARARPTKARTKPARHPLASGSASRAGCPCARSRWA